MGLPVLLCGAALPLAAWEPLAQNELAALLGAEPQYSVAAAGLPLPPSRAEARAKAGFRYELQRTAMKRVLVYRTSVAKGDRRRITQANNRSSAAMARHLGTPEEFCVYLERLASGELSRRDEYTAERALRALVQEVYGIDVLQIRLLSEQLQAPAAEHTLCLLQLPISSLFDVASPQKPEKEQALRDTQVMTAVLRQAQDALAKVVDARTAQTAAEQLAALLPVWNSTLQTRAHVQTDLYSFSSVEKLSIQLLNHTTERLMQTRRALAEKGWYGNKRLQLLDALLR